MKNKNLSFLIIALASVLTATTCQKEKPPPQTMGVVFCTIQDTTSFKTAYTYFSSLGLSIHASFPLGIFYYIADTNAEKLSLYRDTIYSKKYVKVSAQYVKNIYQPISNRDSVIGLQLAFSSFSTNEANDWFGFTNNFKLYEVPYIAIHAKSGGIKVPVGQEDYYVNEFKKNPMIISTHR